MKKKLAVSIILLCASVLAAFNNISIHHDTDIARMANRSMWDNLHLGNYDSIPAIIQKLNAAYVEDPKDSKITAHLGFVHLWAFSERGRKAADSSVLNHVYLSNYFFKEAIRLNPNDPRLRGFQSSMEMCEGALAGELPQIMKGYVRSLKAIKKWPQFNRSALSFIESQMDTNSFLFRQGINYQWRVIDECSCKALDKKTIMSSPEKVLKDLISELKNSDDPLIKRACWNSWIAPHNLEGFFLNFGDMLVKEGHMNEAREMYLAAKLSPSYNEWMYKSVLEDRLKNMAADNKIFNRRLKLIYPKNDKQIFINSKISCVACHRMSKKEFEESHYRELPDEIYFLNGNK